MSEQQDWVRQHLADLPAVSMPPEVRDRLDAAIREQAAGSPLPGSTGEPNRLAVGGDAGPTESAFESPNSAAEATQGPRRWWLGVAGAAAALVALALVNPLGLTGGDSGGDAVAERAAEPENGTAAEPFAAESGDPDGQRPSRLQIQQASLASPMSYSEASLGDRLREFLADNTETPAPVGEASPNDSLDLPDSWRLAGQVAAATPEGLVDCVWALPWDGELLLVVERAAYNADPAIIVVRQEGARWEVTVQDSACSANDPYLLHRATVER